MLFCETAQPNSSEMIIGKTRFRFIQKNLIICGEGIVWDLKEGN
jgi:hypothetical protein